MANEKTTTRDAWKAPFNPAGDAGEAVSAAAKKPVKVVAFEIDDADVGGDPYNHTGSFCVPEFDEQ